MINKHRTSVTDKKKLPTPIVAPQEAISQTNSIAKIEKSEKNATPKGFIPEKASIVSTASKDTKDTVTITTNAAEPVKLLVWLMTHRSRIRLQI
jgi:hypothetical protein